MFSRRLLGKIYGHWSNAPLADKAWVEITSALLALINWPTRVSYDSSRKMFRVLQGETEIFVARRSRVARVLWSLDARLEELFNGYGLHKVRNLAGAIVLDVGANIGEVSLLFRVLGARTVHSFEPDPAEFECLLANVGSGIHPHQSALWNESGSATLFRANATGDSSLLSPGNSEGLTTVSTITLDHWATENLGEDAIVDLLKLEAEGAEPEILEGGVELLKRVRYVTADVGFERPGDGGVDSTLPAVTNFLTARGFSVVWVGSPRLVVVYRNEVLAAE